MEQYLIAVQALLQQSQQLRYDQVPPAFWAFCRATRLDAAKAVQKAIETYGNDPR